MPTENRSSNTEIAAVLAPFAAVADCYDDAEEDSFQPAHDIGLHKDLALTLGQFRAVRTLLARPAPQPHAEPIAWMVGTAFWWTKEEAERDAAATGLPIVGLGPMTDRTATELADSETMAAIAELAECEAMADMVAEREWAEHVGTGDVSSKVEAAFTQLHNDLHEAGEKLAERDTLLRLVRDGNGYLDEQDWERINAITEHGSGEAIQSQHVSYERLLRDVATELREPSSVGWEDDMASRIDVALARKPS